MKCFNAKKAKRSHTVKLVAPPKDIFPLLCPVREEEWTSGWENDTYELIYTESEFNEEGCIFKTSYPDGNDSLWTCTKYDKENNEVEFLVHVKDLVIRKMNILLKINEEHTTDARFEYTVTALSEKGNAIVNNLDEDIIKSASGLGMMINYYLQNGKKLNINEC
jgi:hypothetical protein